MRSSNASDCVDAGVSYYFIQAPQGYKNSRKNVSPHHAMFQQPAALLEVHVSKVFNGEGDQQALVGYVITSINNSVSAHFSLDQMRDLLISGYAQLN